MRAHLCSLLLAVACGRSKPPPTAAPQPHATASTQPVVARTTRPACGNDVVKCVLDTFGYFTEQVCRCTDRACVDGVNKELSEWGAQLAKGHAKDTKPTPEFTTAMGALTERFTGCVTKLYMEPTEAEPGAGSAGG